MDEKNQNAIDSLKVFNGSLLANFVEPFADGTRVRIKPDAFPESTDENDVIARGQVGTIVGWDTWDGENYLYYWVGDDHIETAPISSELEIVR